MRSQELFFHLVVARNKNLAALPFFKDWHQDGPFIDFNVVAALIEIKRLKTATDYDMVDQPEAKKFLLSLWRLEGYVLFHRGWPAIFFFFSMGTLRLTLHPLLTVTSQSGESWFNKQNATNLDYFQRWQPIIRQAIIYNLPVLVSKRDNTDRIRQNELDRSGQVKSFFFFFGIQINLSTSGTKFMKSYTFLVRVGAVFDITLTPLPLFQIHCMSDITYLIIQSAWVTNGAVNCRPYSLPPAS